MNYALTMCDCQRCK